MEKPQSVKIAIFGLGSFGTAMAVVAARNDHEVVGFCRSPDQAAAINSTHRNPYFMPEFELPHNIRATTNFREAVENAVLIIHCIPAQMTPSFLRDHRDDIPAHVPVCITSKGLHLETKSLLSDAVINAMEREQNLAFLSGPSFAKELIQGHPTAVVVASNEFSQAQMIQNLLSNLLFRVYTSDDVIGVQLGGALKNPLAIGAGMIQGCGFGINTMAAYVTRSSLELQRLCVAMGGKPSTISGLAGVGDLTLTAFGDLSRNRSFGIRITKGENMQDILSQMTVEGVPTAAVAVYFAELCSLELPIFRTVNKILNGELAIQNAHEELMGRPLKKEDLVL